MEVDGLRGICILSHFCETHGPNFIFCTQLVAEHNNLYVLSKDTSSSVPQEIPKVKETPQAFEYPDPYASLVIDDTMRQRVKEYADSIKSKNIYSSSEESCTTDDEDGKTRSGMLDILKHHDPNSLPKKPQKVNELKKCLMCSSMDEGTGFISASRVLPNSPEEQNLEMEQFYGISGKNPADSLYSIVRRISVRALSCEVCPGLEGPLVFSEAEGKFYALSYMFKVKDFHARGHQRCYSLILLLDDSTRMLSAFNIVTSQFRQIVNNLQTRGMEKYNREKEEGSSATTSAIRPDRRFALRSGRGMVNRSKSNLRALEDLLDYKNLYIDLHLRFSHTLTVVNSFICSKSFGRVSFDVRIFYFILFLLNLGE